jgi:hypothetical protein
VTSLKFNGAASVRGSQPLSLLHLAAWSTSTPSQIAENNVIIILHDFISGRTNYMHAQFHLRLSGGLLFNVMWRIERTRVHVLLHGFQSHASLHMNFIWCALSNVFQLFMISLSRLQSSRCVLYEQRFYPFELRILLPSSYIMTQHQLRSFCIIEWEA